MINHDTRSVLVGLLAALGLVVLVSLIGATVHAKVPAPSASDYAHLSAIVKRQPRIQELKKYRDELNTLKAANETDARAINGAWTIDWATMKLVPFTQE